MSELQAKIKEIQTELEAICANANQSQRRLAALVELPDFEPPLNPSVKAPFANQQQAETQGAAPSHAMLEAESEFRRPSSSVSLPNFPSRSQLHSPDRSAAYPSNHRVPVTQARIPQARTTQTPVRQTDLQNNASAAIKDTQSQTPHRIQELKAQAEQINQLSQTQEVALRRLQAIAAQMDQERRKKQSLENSSAQTTRSKRLSLPLEQPVPPVEIPQPVKPETHNPKLDATEPLTLRIYPPIDPNEMADEMAQMLRQRQERRQAEHQAEHQEQFAPYRRSRRRVTLLKRLRRWFLATPSCQETAEALPFTLRETLTLLLGAALTRLLLNLLLEAVPLLTIPIMILLVVPAAIAVHRATTAPQSGIIWGYRLCVILLGLLIGGRL
jgi:hypothetical protein